MKPAKDDSYDMGGRWSTAVRSSHGDDGMFIIGWFIKIALSLSILSIVAFDAVAVLLARSHTEQAASDAADAGAESYRLHPDLKAAFAAASTAATAAGATLARGDFTVTKAGAVSVTIHSTASTLVLAHVPGTDDLIHPSATATRKAPVS